MPKTLTFIGFQGCGKTTLGRLLAKQLELPFIDTDQLIEQFHPPLTCSDIYKAFGSPYFRQLENQVINALNYESPFVLAIGGGSLLYESNTLKLKEHSLLFYLKTSAEILKERIWKRPNLPGYLIAKNPHEAFDRIYQERCAIYDKWADYTIHMDALNIEQTLETILMYCTLIR